MASKKIYNESNNTTLPIVSISKKTKDSYNNGRNLLSITQKDLQNIANNICDDFDIMRIPVDFSGIQPSKIYNNRISRKVLGRYSKICGFEKIRVFRFSPKQKKQIAPKTTIEVLLHELIHYFDMELFHLGDTIHCLGFHKRISQLRDMIK